MKVAVTGASGLIGRALTQRLTACGDRVVPVVRRAAGDGEISWSPSERRIASGAFEGIDAVVHLAGAGIADHRWTEKYKRQILESRTRGTALVSEAVAAADDGPSVLLSGSAIGFYGPGDDAAFDESSPAGSGFLADVCVRWETATALAAESGARVVHLRTGVVLSPDGGALKKQLPLFRVGAGGRFGNGRQWQSWISITDEVDAIVHLLGSELDGPVNLTAPEPVSNADFAAILGEVLGRPSVLAVPKFGPRALLGGELADSLLFTGQRVLPEALLTDGYRFRHPDLRSALRDLLNR